MIRRVRKIPLILSWLTACLYVLWVMFVMVRRYVALGNLADEKPAVVGGGAVVVFAWLVQSLQIELPTIVTVSGGVLAFAAIAVVGWLVMLGIRNGPPLSHQTGGQG